MKIELVQSCLRLCIDHSGLNFSSDNRACNIKISHNRVSVLANRFIWIKLKQREKRFQDACLKN